MQASRGTHSHSLWHWASDPVLPSGVMAHGFPGTSTGLAKWGAAGEWNDPKAVWLMEVTQICCSRFCLTVTDIDPQLQGHKKDIYIYNMFFWWYFDIPFTDVWQGLVCSMEEDWKDRTLLFASSPLFDLQISQNPLKPSQVLAARYTILYNIVKWL